MQHQANSDPYGVQGSVQVTARGADNTRCQASAEPSGAFDNVPTDMIFYVQCVAPDGTPRDAPFVATFLRRTDVFGLEGGYVGANPDFGFPQTFSATGEGAGWPAFAGAVGAAEHDFLMPHWNSTGGGITVQQYGPGVYEALFEGQDSAGGTAEVMAIDQNRDGHHCELSSWYGWYWDYGNQDVWVYCFDARGEPDDVPFDLRWTMTNPTIAGGYAYAFADNAYATSSYVPILQYQFGFDGCNPTPPVTIEPYGLQPGGYVVHFPGLDTLAAHGGVPMVSAMGQSGEYCKIGSWGASEGSAYVGVQCFDYTGQPTPANFTIAYMVDRLMVC
jgi:hypothetical protein